MTDEHEVDRVYMAEIERVLLRDRSTIRTWERQGWLPAELAFSRDENGWRYWTRAQLFKAEQWLKERNPGRTAFGKRQTAST